MLAPIADSRLRRYWLQQLDEPEMTAIEHRYFADRDFFRELEAAAERLADEYVRGVLVGSERDAIEALACTREWRLRLALAAERVVGR